MTFFLHDDNIGYDMEVGHQDTMTHVSPTTQKGFVEVNFVLEESLTDLVWELTVEASLSDLSRLDEWSSSSPSVFSRRLLDFAWTYLRLPPCCVQRGLFSQLAEEARKVEPERAEQVVITVDITMYTTLHTTTSLDAALEESFQEAAGSVRAPRASEESIEELERFVFDDKLDILDGDGDDDHETVCTVCMDAMEPGDRVARMPCGHVYHDNCIVKWLGVSCFCPVCRYQLPMHDD